MRNVANYTIMDRIGTLTDTFTAAVTDICTQSSHGLKNGDPLVLTTTGTLPAGLALATVYYVIEAATNTFKLSLTKPHSYTTGTESAPVPVVDITGTGTGTHTYTMHDIGNNIFVQDFRNSIISLDGYADNNCTVKFVGSIAETCPDFSAAQAYDNAWEYIEIIDLQNGSAIDGDTGVAQAGTNDHRLFEMNVNGLTWINAIITAWSAGSVTVKCKLFNN